MAELTFLTSPCKDSLLNILSETKKDLVIASPFITAGQTSTLLERISHSTDLAKLRISILTDLKADNLLSGSLDISALQAFYSASPLTQITYLPSLHAKVYIADDKSAVITSANLTSGGFENNVEYGVLIRDSVAVSKVRKDLIGYATLGNVVTSNFLKSIESVSQELRELYRAKERNVKNDFRKALNNKIRAVNNELLSLSVEGKTTHSIFAQTILYLLSQRPMRTVELNPIIQRLHPDICDDSVEKVIGNVYFGKKWKHHVRTAQSYLRRNGSIKLESGIWRLT